MEKITITTEYITLGQFLKMNDFISSGGEAKFFLNEKMVWINNEKENRRGRKIYPHDIVKIEGKEFVIDA